MRPGREGTGWQCYGIGKLVGHVRHADALCHMIGALKALWRRGCGAVPLSWWIRYAGGNRVALMYHMVADQSPAHVRHLYASKTPEQFRADLLAVRTRFDIVSYGQFAERQVPKRPQLLITFDDGLRECLDNALPVLSELRVPALFFITTEWIDNASIGHDHLASLCIQRAIENGTARREACEFLGIAANDVPAFAAAVRSLAGREDCGLEPLARLLGVDARRFLSERRPYLCRPELLRLVRDGHALGAHSVRHQHLHECDTGTVMADIACSCECIRALLGVDRVPYAFPYTAAGLVERLEREALNAAGADMVFGTDGALPHPSIVNRVPMDNPPPEGIIGASLGSALRADYTRWSLHQAGRRLRRGQRLGISAHA